MKKIKENEEAVTIEMTSIELNVLYNVLYTVRQQYGILDEVILKSEYKDITAVFEGLIEVINSTQLGDENSL